MAESTLSQNFATIRRTIAHYLGYDRLADTSEGLTSEQNDDVDAYFNEGMRTFLGAHNWSFLTPTVSVMLWATTTGTESGSSGTTFSVSSASFYPTMIGHSIVMASGNSYTITDYVSSTTVTIGSNFNVGVDGGTTFTITANGVYRMPDAFGGIIGPITYENNKGSYSPIELVSERQVAELLQRSTSTGWPTVAAQRPVQGTSTTEGQRWDLLVWRIPDSNYQVYFKEILLVDQIGAGQFPVGGMLHADTLTHACLAAAEYGMNDMMRGPRWERYQQLLAQSIALDRRLNRSETLGEMRDDSDRRSVHPANLRINHLVTVEGNLP